VIEGRLTRKRIPRTNDYQHAADRYHTMMDWERDDLIFNMIDLLGQCDRHIQERMVWHFYLIEDDYGNRVGEGLGIKVSDVAHLKPLPKQQLTEEDQQRLANLGNNPPRKLTGEQITGSVHVMRADEVSANGSTNGPAFQASEMQPSKAD
jgi:catalase